MASFTYLQSAKIRTIFDDITGLTIDAEDFVGNDDNALKLRTTLRQDIERGTPRYLCESCFKPIYLRSNPGKTGQLFAHVDTDNNCPKLEKYGINQQQINAIKYNGRKESRAHKETKQLLYDSLVPDKNFSDILIEKTWKSKNNSKRYRRPDVQALYRGKIRIAFEIQLSTIFLTDIVKRSEFYLEEDALIIWVFRNFEKQDPRLTQLDIFYPNNMNAFVISNTTKAISVESNRFHLHCHWAEPQAYGKSKRDILNEKIVKFAELNILKDKQQAYYYDYKKEEQTVLDFIKKEKLNSLCTELKTICDNTSPNNQSKIESINKELKDFGYKIPFPPEPYVRLIKAIYSLEIGRVVGIKYDYLIQWANILYDYYPQFIFIFLSASVTYNRVEKLKENGDKKKWKSKKKEIWNDLKTNGSSSRFFPDNSCLEILILLFPEIEDEYNRLNDMLKKYWQKVSKHSKQK